MPSQVKLELTTLWHRETALVGAYAYGAETLPDGERRRTFDSRSSWCGGRPRALGHPHLRRSTTSRTPIAHAANAGRRGAVKVAFDLRQEKERRRP